MPQKLTYQDWTNLDLFKGLEKTELDTIVSKLVFRMRTFKTDDVLAHRGEVLNSLMLLVEGELHAEIMEPGANDLRIETLTAGNMIAPAFLFGKLNQIPVTLTVSKVSIVMFIHKNDLLSLFQVSRTVLVNYLNHISGKAQFLAEKIHLLNFKSLKQRIAAYVLNRCGDDYISFELDITQEELARLFGVARTSLIRAFNSMEADGLLSMDNRIIRINNKEKLKKCGTMTI
ncbi:MAG: Crp/Fnr family transcriptional regulator [Bacteroidales bacterium]